MKRLILDYFRRKIWILAVGVALELLIGWLIVAAGRAFSGTDIGFQLQMALFIGVMPLLFDLQRGVARTVASLPLTAAQIGRAWWLATVGIPGIAISALLFLGAGAFHFLHPHTAFPTGHLAMISVFTLLWLGAGFTTIFGIAGGCYGSLWYRVRNVFFAILWGILCGFGLILFRDLSTNSVEALILLGFGTVMTVVGWLCAGRFVLGRASFRPASMHLKNPRGRHRAPVGYGGLPLLISTTFVRCLLMVLGVVAAIALMMAMDGGTKSWHQLGAPMALVGSSFPAWFIIIFFQVLPAALLQIRLLRTLPITATKLAAVLIAIAILPFIATGVIIAAAVELTSNSPLAFTFFKGFALTLAPASMCVFFAVWLGVGKRAYALMIVTMLAFQITSVFERRQLSPVLTDVIVAATVTLAFLLTRRSIIQSSQTYRIQASPFGNPAWGMGR